LGNTSWRIKGVEMGRVRVEDAHGAPPNIPFWRGEAPSRTAELSAEVADVRREIAERALNAQQSALQWLKQECGLDTRGAQQAVEYVLSGRAVLGTIPTQDTIVAERFFDESGGMQLVIHAPFGGRINKAWGLALRKRFCVTFDFELQAAATDNGLVISLGEKHSFPLESVFGYLHSQTVRDVLLHAVLAAPMFATRWRWNASRALALLRFSQGKKVPPQILRMKAEDLLAAVFPDAIACQDNMTGDRERRIPDHPLVQETLRDCLTEAMDIDGLTHLLKQIENGAIRCVAVDTPAPSLFSHEILNANPYAFLDDAPLEERRARAVELRRTLPVELAGDVGALDSGAIDEVVKESWPVVRDADELHDALLSLLWLPCADASGWQQFMAELKHAGRADELTTIEGEDRITGWAAAEHAVAVARTLAGEGDERTLDAIVLGWMESIGPTTTRELSVRLQVPAERIEGALVRLEGQGQILRGRFRPDGRMTHLTSQISKRPEEGKSPLEVTEWCHRRLLARIHRRTVGKLRKEIEPVSTADFMRFLFQWQHVAPGSRQHGETGLLQVVKQLAGFEAAASSWDSQLLRVRMGKYEPALLDHLCLSGAVSWGRLAPHPRLTGQTARELGRRITPTSVAPISLFPREDGMWLLDALQDDFGKGPDPYAALSAVAQNLRRALEERGASFFSDLVAASGHLPAEVEEGLWELVAAGLVTADGFDNLRALMDPRRRRAEGRERARRPRHAAGRWSLLRQAGVMRRGVGGDSLTERVAQQLLHRYGVVFRDLLAREVLVQSWRDLLVVYRRMELKGEVRGGRFVSGYVGEQFALPEAVEALRAIKKNPGSAAGMEIKLSACDPLNLSGVILPGPRVPAVPSTFILFRDGLPVRIVTAKGRRPEDGEILTVSRGASLGP
jgi:ATP-dependent Lhr-like helicase